MIKSRRGWSAAKAEERWLKAFRTLHEFQARLFAADKALDLGRGGIRRLARWTGLSRTTITKGVGELQAGRKLTGPGEGRVREVGGGRKKMEETDPAVPELLPKIWEETTAGDPMSWLRWTCKSTRTLAKELTRLGHPVTWVTVARCLDQMEYSLQANRKTKEGPPHAHGDAQFRYLHGQVKAVLRGGDPVIGVYDTGQNRAVVNVGVTPETAEFGVESIRQWWKLDGCKTYPAARRLLICADAGGSNGHRLRAWKVNLHKLAGQMSIPITVCHYPPGTSKWNKIEHRLFSFISLNWKGVPLINYETIINRIGATQTRAGLEVQAVLDRHEYEKGIKVSDKELEAVRLRRHKFHPEWNYTILPP